MLGKYPYPKLIQLKDFLRVIHHGVTAEDVVYNFAREKGKPRCKLSYKLLKEEDGHDQLIEMSPYPTFIQLKYFLGGIHHCVTVFGKWIFDSNFTFALPPTKENLDYCCINDNEKKEINFYKGVLKIIRIPLRGK